MIFIIRIHIRINISIAIINIIIMTIQEGWPTVFMPAPDAGAGNPSSKGTAAADAAAGPHAGSAAAIGTPTPSQRKRRQNTLRIRGKTPPAKPMKSAMKARRPRAPSTSSVSCSGSPDKRDCRVHKVLISGPTAEQNPRVEVCGVVMFQKRRVKTHVKTTHTKRTGQDEGRSTHGVRATRHSVDYTESDF